MVGELAERGWFVLSLALGRLLRAARYSTTRIVHEDGRFQVRKQRSFYAPPVVWLGSLLLRILDTGVRVLPQRAWEERERLMYRSLHGASIRIDDDGGIVLPRLDGQPLATLLEDPELASSARKRATQLAVDALAGLHGSGITHGDAMAENVMVDLEAGVARWFDFETIHDSLRPMAWRRADDVRALVATSLLRTRREALAETLRLILDVYRDEDVARILAASFTSALPRAIIFHLGQAPLSFVHFHEIGRLLRERE